MHQSIHLPTCFISKAGCCGYANLKGACKCGPKAKAT